ncbi:MAG: hypothetical protein DRJ50_13225 [Actinobacteria bacterium]|nr:MAG: hypothetical protein DRJ50_13225 [Actinomycetota bacterium]
MALLLVISACSGSDSGDDSSGSADAFGSGAAFSIESALDEIPAAAANSADGDYSIEITDLLAAGELVGAERPTGSTDREAVFNWLGPITGLEESALYVPVPQELLGDMEQIGEYREEVGFAVSDVDASVSLRAVPGSLVVLAGDLEVAASLEDSGGVFTLGEGEDFEVDIDNRTAARQLGQPLRLSTSDGLVAMSASTDVVTSWADPDSERLSADVDLLAVARALDDRSVVGARIVRGDFAWSDDSDDSGGSAAELIEGQLPIRAPFDTIGLGWGVTDGAAAITVVYVFADEAAAAAASAEIETALSTAESLVFRGPISDIVVLGEVAAQGSLVVATLTLPTGRPPSIVQQMLLGRDAPFVHAS